MSAAFEGLITYLVQALVERPEQVVLTTREAEGAQLYELKVAPEDVGKVIGRDGRTIHALRTLLTTAAGRKGERARLEVLDDRRQRPATPGPAAEPPAQ